VVLFVVADTVVDGTLVVLVVVADTVVDGTLVVLFATYTQGCTGPSTMKTGPDCEITQC
jgi:hypothetical protein